MSIFGLPLILFQVEGVVCCADSQFVTIFSNGTRTGTEEVIFDTKQSEKIYYFVDYVSGTGSGTINLQIQNEITGNWEDVDFIGTFSTVNEVLKLIISFEPDNSLSRIQIVTTGSWEGSVTAILVNPKFT